MSKGPEESSTPDERGESVGLEPADDHLFVVGVGSSAGGLDALTVMLRHLGSPSPDFCVIICQHVSPDFRSRLTELLQHVTEWDVVVAEEGAPLEGGKVYVVPPNHHLELIDHHIDLKRYTGSKPVPSVDRFFESLAVQIQSRAIGIILSGTGSDGAEGMRAINEHNGCTLVQNPGDAKHADMPKSVIRNELYDKILLAQEMPREIRQCVRNYNLIRGADASDAPLDELSEEQVDARILDLLERRTGTNFAKYKPSTIFRRIGKRLEALRLEDKRAYLKYIKRTPKELNKLFETVLIGVTEFFRDREAFEALEAQLRDLIGKLDRRRVIRVWSVGTATGEEAYSIAILLREILGADFNHYDVQIFATDIDERALAVARKGQYPHAALSKLPEAYRERYFLREEGYYEARNSLRSMILFSRHDITVDPPFLRLNLLVCRNVLIYFNNFLQEEVLRVFHYALTDHGILFLGKSESTSPRNDVFERITERQKLFRRLPLDARHDYRVSRTWTRSLGRRKRANADDDGKRRRSRGYDDRTLRQLARDALFEQLPYPYVLVSSAREAVEIKGPIGPYTALKTGATTLNIVKLVVPELSLELRALLSKVEKSRSYAASHPIRLDAAGEVEVVRLHVYPVARGEAMQLSYLVVFEPLDDQREGARADGDRGGFVDLDQLMALEHELAATKEHLALFTEELETSNEELQTLNEELQSANEELKSSNEELETSNEELQSTNEELQTANQELRITNDELADKEDQLRRAQAKTADSLNRYETLAANFPNGVIATIDLERKYSFIRGRILARFGLTPEMLVGTPATALLDTTNAEALGGIIEEAFRGNSDSCVIEFRERFITITSIPLSNDVADEIHSVLITSQDITGLKQLQASAEQTNRDLEATLGREQVALRRVEQQRQTLQDLFESAPAFIIVAKGPELRYEYANPLSFSARRAEDLEGKTLFEIVPELDRPEARALVQTAYDSGTTQEIAGFQLALRPIGVNERHAGYFDVSIIPTRDPEGAVDGLIFFATDVTEVTEAKELTEASADRMRGIIDSLPLIAWTAPASGTIDFFNQRWYAYTGEVPGAATDESFEVALHPDDLENAVAQKRRALAEGIAVKHEVRLRGRSGAYRWHVIRVVPVAGDDGEIEYWIGTVVDVHEQKLLSLRKDEFMNIASHELRTPLTALRGYHELLSEDGAVTSEMGRAALRRMGNSIRRMNRLVTELLDISRLESGSFDLDLRRRDVAQAVEQAVSELSADTSRVRIAAKEHLFVEADLDRLVQAIENLVSNALKFSPDDSEVVVSTHDGDGRAHIEISDSGPGISAANRKRIFERYYRTEGARGVDGLGLGLYIAREIVVAHGGTLEVANRPSGGAQFSIVLPLAGPDDT